MIQALKEAKILLGKATFRKLWNILLLKLSFYISILLKRVIHWGNPMALAIEPTTSCNLRCPECPSGLRSFTRPIGMLDHRFYKQIIDQSAPYLTYLTLYFQGEPYLNPRLFDLIHYASSNNIFTATSTNAHFLQDHNAKKTIESGLDKLIVSVDGIDQKTYEKYRIGGNIDKVFEGIKNLVRWKKQLRRKNPMIVLQFLVLKSNQHQVGEVRKLGRSLGVDQVSLKTAQIYDFKKGSGLIPDNPAYSRYKAINGSYRVNGRLTNDCWRMWSSSVITWDGKVVPCCFDKDADYVLGNLKEDTLQTIWRASGQNRFRQQILNSRKEIDICGNCSNGSNIWIP